MKTCVVGLVLALCCFAQIEDSPSARLRYVEQMHKQADISAFGTFRAGDDQDVRNLILDIDPKRFGFQAGYADDPANRAEIERTLAKSASALSASFCTLGFKTLHINFGSAFGWDIRLDCNKAEKPAGSQAASPVIPSAAQEELPATSIGRHQIGETVQQWQVRSGLPGPFQKEHTMYGDESSITTSDGGRIYKWFFSHDGKLNRVWITPDLQTSITFAFDSELSFLTKAYGEPFQVEEVPYQNGYGAKWTVREAFWRLPDATTIGLFEEKKLAYRGLASSIQFLSKEANKAVEEWQQHREQPNPYRQ